MSSVWRSLLWKEWREHRWKLAALAAIAVVVPVLMSIKTPGNIYGAVTFTLTLAVPLGAIFIGMHAAASERSQGTIRFLQALPTPLTKPAMAKLTWAAITVLAPVVAAVVGAGLWKAGIAGSARADDLQLSQDFFGSPWGITDWYAATLVAGGGGGLSILIWMAAFGVNRSDEVRAGAIGLLAILACWAALTMALNYAPRQPAGRLEWPQWYRILSAAAPGGATASAHVPTSLRQIPLTEPRQDLPNAYVPILAMALASHGALAAWYIARFGRVSQRREPPIDVVRNAAAAAAVQLRPPFSRPLTALVWKQSRECAPLAALGAGLIALAATWVAYESRNSEDAVESATGVAFAMWLLVGAFVSVVAGVGAFMDDLQPGLFTFWRSRPIEIDQWFVIKIALTMAVTMAILAVPPMLLIAFTWLGGERQQFASSLIPNGLMLQAGLFATAAAVMAIVRQAIYAAILAFAVAVAYTIAVAWIYPQWHPDAHFSATAIIFAAPTAAALLVAWLAVRNNWGWKG